MGCWFHKPFLQNGWQHVFPIILLVKMPDFYFKWFAFSTHSKVAHVTSTQLVRTVEAMETQQLGCAATPIEVAVLPILVTAKWGV